MELIDKISIGDYIVIKRQKYTKLHKFNSLDSTTLLGKDLIELRNIVANPYSTTFRMIPKESTKGKRLNTLEPCLQDIKLTTVFNNQQKSGIDNRNIIDNGQSQSLTADEIEKLRENCSSSIDIVSHIVENSKTFSSKTEYSQEKYLKKKEKKYFEFVQIEKPNIRMITEIMYRQGPEKIYWLRKDSLSQIISYLGVCSTGNYLAYESGTNGLIPAALINSIGSNTEANVVHMHPGNVSQKQALLALNLPNEQLNRCISVNIYSVLRHYYQNFNNESDGNGTAVSSGIKRKIDEESEENINNVPFKLMRNEVEITVDEINSTEINIKSHIEDQQMNTEKETLIKENDEIENLVLTQSVKSGASLSKQQWVIDNQRACNLLKIEMDGMIIVSKEHPLNIFKHLIPFIKPSRPIVIYNTSKEILTEMYIDLKASSEVTNLRLTTNWLRSYQILENRSHPDVIMNGNNGYLLCGYTVGN